MVTSTWGTSGPVKRWPLVKTRTMPLLQDEARDTRAGQAVVSPWQEHSGAEVGLTQTWRRCPLPSWTYLLDLLILRGPRAAGPSPSPGAAPGRSLGRQSQSPRQGRLPGCWSGAAQHA